MGKDIWKPGTVIYPGPAVMVSCGTMEEKNIITVAWTGTVNSDPAMTYVSIRPSRYSYQIIKERGEFVINLVTEKLAYACDYCGVKSGRDIDKFAEMKLTATPGEKVAAPMIAESPVNIECRVVKVEELGSHHMFVAEVVAVHADEKYLDDRGRFELAKADPIVYSHGTYFTLDQAVGTFGYSVRKPLKGKGFQKNSRKKSAQKSAPKSASKSAKKKLD